MAELGSQLSSLQRLRALLHVAAAWMSPSLGASMVLTPMGTERVGQTSPLRYSLVLPLWGN